MALGQELNEIEVRVRICIPSGTRNAPELMTNWFDEACDSGWKLV